MEFIRNIKTPINIILIVIFINKYIINHKSDLFLNQTKDNLVFIKFYTKNKTIHREFHLMFIEDRKSKL